MLFMGKLFVWVTVGKFNLPILEFPNTYIPSQNQCCVRNGAVAVLIGNPGINNHGGLIFDGNFHLQPLWTHVLSWHMPPCISPAKSKLVYGMVKAWVY